MGVFAKHLVRQFRRAVSKSGRRQMLSIDVLPTAHQPFQHRNVICQSVSAGTRRRLHCMDELLPAFMAIEGRRCNRV